MQKKKVTLPRKEVWMLYFKLLEEEIKLPFKYANELWHDLLYESASFKIKITFESSGQKAKASSSIWLLLTPIPN